MVLIWKKLDIQLYLIKKTKKASAKITPARL